MNGLGSFIRNSQHLRNASIAVLSNHATLSSAGYPIGHELMRQGFSVTKIFSPEHGISSQGEDGKAQPSHRDPVTGLPVVSLYGQSVRPEAKDLSDVDIVLADLPNIGCRFYTYWWTITYMIEACAALNKKIILLDRPNLSGRTSREAEGPLLDEAHCQSFLGRWQMPLTHGYSFGQLAKWFIHARSIDVQLEVIPFERNELAMSEPFIPTSPSMPSGQSVQCYPCTALFEGLNINTGRGTSFPFRVIGAPWLNSIRLFEDFVNHPFAGIKAYPYTYQPEWSRYGGELCHGLFFTVTNARAWRPVHVGLWLMNYLSINYPGNLAPALYPTAANPGGENHLDMLLGVRDSFGTFCSGKALSDKTVRMLDVSAWTGEVDGFLASGE